MSAGWQSRGVNTPRLYQGDHHEEVPDGFRGRVRPDVLDPRRLRRRPRRSQAHEGGRGGDRQDRRRPRGLR